MTATTSPTARRWTPGAAFIALACLAAPHAPGQPRGGVDYESIPAQDPLILQWFEGSWSTMHRRMGDVFAAGYRGLWVPPPGRGTGDATFIGQIGYDVYDRFDLGRKNGTGAATRYGDASTLGRLIDQAERARLDTYYDSIMNHNGSGLHSNGGFVDAGGYPGFAMSYGGDPWGDFNPPSDNSDELTMYLANLIDIAQDKNHVFIRHPAADGPNNVPGAGTKPNQPIDWYHRRFYPDLDPAPGDVLTPSGFNLTNPLGGDPVPENATGLLLRYTQYMNEVAGFTGIRIDAVKHIPTWFFNNLWDGVIRDRGRPTLEGGTTTPFSFGEAFTGDVGQLLSYHNRSFGNNRTVLDFNHYFTLNGVMNAGGFGNLQDLVWANIDNENGNRFDGSAGVYFIASHDKEGGGGSNIGNFWVAMRKGHANIYHKAGEFPPVQINGVDQDFPKSGGSRGDAIGAFVPDSFGNSSLIADMADIRRRFAFGDWRERWLGADVLAFEYDGRVVYALCDAGNSGYQSITVQTAFPPFTLLEELTGNAARYNDRTGTTDIPVTINVNELGQAALRVPNNSHAFGYVAYAPVTPDFSWGLTNVESTLPPDGEMTPVATRRLTEVRRINSASSTLTVTTDGTENEVLVNIGNRDLNGSGQPDIRRGALAGFESFTTASTGSYSMTIDWSALGDGHHFVEIAAVKGGLGGQHAAVWSSERFTVLVDLEAPNGSFASPPASHVVMGGETLHVQVLTDGTEDNALINVSPAFVPDRPNGEFGQMRALGRRYWGLDVVPNSSDRVITVRLFEDDGSSRDIVRTLLGPGDMTPTPTITPTPAPDMNPFTMDGALDAGTCQIGDLRVKEQNGWLYVATNAVQAHDAFIYVASDPSTLQAANWAKAGQVGAWDFFLGGEESNDFAGWFDSGGNSVSNGPDYVSARSGTFMEGAIRKSMVGGGVAHVALGRFATADGGALQDQSPASVDADGDIQAAEFRAIITGLDPCSGMTPTPSPTPTITPTPTPTPDPGARTLTTGPGPSLGFTAGREYFEEFQDWRAEDCRALDEHSTDTYLLQGGSDDGLNNSRDLVAFYTYDDPVGGKFHLRADLLDLLYDGGVGGVNMSGLDLIVMLDFGTPASGQEFVPNFADATTAHEWEVALVLHAHDEWELWDQTFALLSRKNSDPEMDINTGAFGVYSNADLDAFEMSIDRSILTGEGWDGTSPISIQVATMVSTGFDLPGFASNLVDTLPPISDPVSSTVMTEAFTTTASCGTTPFAYILHGNQAISGADYIQQLIHNDIVQTPNGNPTGYHRALETASLFKAAPTIHVSATLIASMLWAKSPVPSDPQDGPSFVDFIKSFVDGSASIHGHITSGVFSEHIMPYFEGTANQWSFDLNEDFLAGVFGLSYPQANTIFWVPERVIQGTTFADFATAGYNWIVLDEDEHLKSWFPAEHPGNAHRMHRINGTNVLWISEEQDYFKFANTDGGLWLDTRTHLLDLARAGGEEYTLVFDDWEAYAGRSFLSFETGTDNPDNWNANIRWIANHPWIEVTALDDLASRGWTPMDLGTDATLPIRSYDFLQHATEGSYDNWYYGRANDGLAAEEDYDDYQPFIRTDLNQRSPKVFGQVNTNTHGPARGIAKDVLDEVSALDDNGGARLARLSYSTGTFETAWHDEDQATRCGDRTFCIPDTTDDPISDWQKRITFHNLRKTGIYAEVARWEAGLAPPRGAGATALAKDVDHDGEMEYLLSNDFMIAFFENDGGRLIASFVRDESTGRAYSTTGNLLGFPDFEDEREASSTGGVRTSAFVDWWVQGAPDPSAYVNDIYTVQVNAGELVFTSSDGLISKSLVMAPGEALLTAAYTVDPSVTALYVRHGLAPDIEALLTGGQAALALAQGATRVTLTNTVYDVRAIANAGSMAFTQFSDGTSNSPRNQPLLHIVELAGTGASFSTSLGAGAGSVAPTPTPTATPTMTPTFSPTPTFTPTPSATPSITPGMPIATPGGPDSDGDGYSDALEDALGSSPADPDSTPDFADYNDSSAADLLDALELARALGGTILQPYNALLDINGDGFVTQADAVALYQWCIGSLDAIPGEEP